MASLIEEIADALARDVLRAVELLGDENLVTEVSRVIGSSSTTTQEAFMTAVRVRMSEQRARRLLADRVGADWPLEPGASGSGTIPGLAALAQAAALAPTTAPRAPRVVMPDPQLPAVELAAAPRLAEPKEPVLSVATAAPTPLSSEPDEVAAEAASLEVAAEPLDPLRVRPKIPAPPPQVKSAPSAPAPRSLEAALALATSLPRKVVAPVEPTTPVVNPYADIEMPDGDWG
jgi:hypothetical protein